jgi:hypothetical protein
MRPRKRRRRRNPDLPWYVKAPLCALAGLGVFAVVSDGTFALTQRTDPSLIALERNLYIVGGLWTVVGIGVAYKAPLLGTAVASGALISMFGRQLTLLLGKVLDKPREQAPQGNQGLGAYQAAMGAVYGQMGAVYGQMGDYQAQMGAYEPQMLGIGAVYGQMGNLAGDYIPRAPWVGNPF